MSKIIASMLAVAALAAVPASSLAATYQYVAINGEVKSVVANTAMEAIAKPVDIAPTSGVLLVTDATEIKEDVEVAL
jgi:hypothetical protein